MARPKFSSGQLVVTRGVHVLSQKDENFAKFVHASIQRHFFGDWGQTQPDDAAMNEAALAGGDRIFSVYKREGLPDIWVITERDRSVTTALFPSEY